MGRRLLASLTATAALAAAGASVAQVAPPSGLDVPLAFWVSASHPLGLPVGATNGISWGDYDLDGYPDLFACASGNLWRNVGGTDWELAQNVLGLLPPATIRYGGSFGDFDADGRPDLALEPRAVMSGDTCFRLLRNVGGAAPFTDVTPLALVAPLCGANGETFGWVDADGDGRLDGFLPVYPAWGSLPSIGNAFLRNLGPVGINGGFLLDEQTVAAGLDNVPPDSARPEGAQFCDVDRDGDADLYAGGFLYQNNSTPGVPSFAALPPASSGIALTTHLDEGAMLLDYDMDGDDDLFVAYEEDAIGVRLWESRGDGRFFAAEGGIIDLPLLGAGLGLSAEDWDNDGDIDFTTRHIFRRNQLVETGQRHYTVAFHGIPGSYISSATPAWADWDRDGDLDCAIGNYLANGSFWVNTLYDAATPADQRRSVRVRVERGLGGSGAAIADEFGAAVELTVEGDAAGLRRRKFVASGHGYLNQNAYELTFGLPADPAPADSATDLRFDIAVTFAGPADSGLRRVDRWVNPALGDIDLAQLADHLIIVRRGGDAIVDGQFTPGQPFHPALLTATTGGPPLPTAAAPLAPPEDAPTADRFVGASLSVPASGHPLRVREIALDGQLDAPVGCGTAPFNIALWDVTTSFPAIVPGGAIAAVTSPRNDRTFVPVDLALLPGHDYRLVARVTRLRTTVEPGASTLAGLTVRGGLNFRDTSPCSGGSLVSAPTQPQKSYLSIRYAPVLTTDWTSLGSGLVGSGGTPSLTGAGELAIGQTVTLTLNRALPLGGAFLVIGTQALLAPLKGGVLVPLPDVVAGPLPVDALGTLLVTGVLPLALPPRFPIYFQAWIPDAAAVKGYAASNGLVGTPEF